MAYDDDNFALAWNSGNVNATRGWSYESSTDAEATVKASGYFDTASDRVTVKDWILVTASDNSIFLKVATNSGGVVTTTEVTVSEIEAGSIIDADINAAAAIAFSKFAALTSTNLLVGSAANVATSRAITGDVTIGNTGVTAIGTDKVLTANILASNVTTAKIAALAVTEAKIALNSLTGLVFANVADANVIGGGLVIHTINTAGGATGNTDVTLTHKTRVLYVIVQNNGAGTASDTITITDASTAITDAIDISGADKTIALVGTIDNAVATIAAAGTLRVTETDGAGSDSPATTVTVIGVRSA